jgi:hypothetical protein
MILEIGPHLYEILGWGLIVGAITLLILRWWDYDSRRRGR